MNILLSYKLALTISLVVLQFSEFYAQLCTGSKRISTNTDTVYFRKKLVLTAEWTKYTEFDDPECEFMPDDTVETCIVRLHSASRKYPFGLKLGIYSTGSDLIREKICFCNLVSSQIPIEIPVHEIGEVKILGYSKKCRSTCK